MRSSDLVAFANQTRKAGHPLLTYRQLDYWVRRGLMGRPGGGSGSKREFDGYEVRMAIVMGHLVEAGLPPDRAARIAQKMLNPESTPDLPASPVIITVDFSQIRWPGNDQCS